MAYQQSRPKYGQCDSYFVDAADDGQYARRAAEREQARIANRQRQRQLAEAISKVTCDDYQEDIVEYMEFMEAETRPDVNAIDIQTEIQWFMRPYLLDFLIEAHAAFQLLPETLYLAVNLLDRYCSRRVVYKRHYQLVGCSALLIAAKYGDRKDKVPTVRELKSMCCSLYDDEMFTQMEWHVLSTLGWAVGHPTVDSFLQLAMAESDYDAEVEHLTWYICEIALFHKEFVSVLPSIMARSALALARCMLSRPVESSEWAGRYDAEVIVSLSQIITKPSQVLQKKYSSPHYSSVSRTVEHFFERQARVAREMAPTPPVEVSFDASSHGYDAYAAPHTPQKGQYPPMSTYGYITPPITPEGDAANVPVHAKYTPSAARCPGTQTPPSSVEQQQLLLQQTQNTLSLFPRTYPQPVEPSPYYSQH